MATGELQGTTALVTGGGSGIGLACARRLAADGADVTICGRTASRLEEAAGDDLRWVVADVTDEDAVAEAVRVAAEPTGRLEAVVACAGGTETIGPLTQLDAAQWRSTVDLNITGTYLTLKHAARVMASNGGGSFVGVSSIAASNTHRWFGAYGVGKAGIDHLCQLAADELGPSAIRVNCVRPGLIRTELVATILDTPEVLEDYLSCMPIRRVGEVDDIANLVRFLVGPESTWVTGQLINVDGGHSLRRGPDLSSVLTPLFGEDGMRGVVSS